VSYRVSVAILRTVLPADADEYGCHATIAGLIDCYETAIQAGAVVDSGALEAWASDARGAGSAAMEVATRVAGQARGAQAEWVARTVDAARAAHVAWMVAVGVSGLAQAAEAARSVFPSKTGPDRTDRICMAVLDAIEAELTA